MKKTLKDYLLGFLSVVIIMMSFSACAGRDNAPPASGDETGNMQAEKTNNETHNIKAINDEKFTNSQGIYLTEKYIYSVDNFAVKRYDRVTYSSMLITDSISDIVCLTQDTVYYIEEDPVAPRLYKLTDEMQSPEYLYELSNDAKFFMDEKYIYEVSQNGSVIRHINSSKKYDDSAEVIYHGMEDNINDIKFYNDNIYFSDRTAHTVMCVSTKDKTAKKINLQGEFNSNSFGTTIRNSKIYYSNNKIIYVDSNSNLYCTDLNNEDSKKFSDIKAQSYFVANGKIYVFGNKEYYCIDIQSNTISDYKIPNESLQMFGYCHTLSDIGTGVVYTDGSNRLIISDYAGNRITSINTR